MMDDNDVERVARAIIEARFADDDDGYDMPVTDYDRDLARAALSAMPERELLREALSALDSVTHCRNPDKCKSCSNIARAAADKIRAALEQDKGEGL